jgi:hypothetical protein
VEWLGWDSSESNCSTILNNNLVGLGVDSKVQVVIYCTGGVDVGMSRVATTASISVDPLEPVLSTMASYEILKIIGGRDTLRLGGSEEILHDWVGVVSK